MNGPKLLAAFQDFFRQHSEHWLKRFDYDEAGAQRVANGGGRVAPEYGLGRGTRTCWWPGRALPGSNAS